MDKKVIVLGAGGHAKVIIDILEQNQEYEIAGIIDYTSKTQFLDYPILGDDSCLEEIYKQGIKYAFVAIGSNAIRKKVAEYLKEIGYELINVISKYAIISKYAKLEKGIVVMPGAIINTYAEIGTGCIINTSATVDHDTKIGMFTHLAPGTHIAGNSSVGEKSFLGVGVNVIDGITIGENTIVGAGSTIISAIPNDCTVVGTPGRVIDNRQ